MTVRLSGLLSIFGSIALLSTVAQAASADADSNATGRERSKDSSLEEIIVTARRREENAQTVPIAITVLSQQTLQDNNVVTLQDMQSLVPSLTVTTGNTGSRDSANVSIRGQGWSGLSSQAAVAMYINEVPVSTDSSNNLAGGPGLLFDLENVQVLKGPQGTLFGRNTMGGAVLLETARPTSEFGGHFQAGYGNYNDREIEGAINIPIVDDVLLTRLAFSGQLRDGFTHVLSMPGYPNGTDLDNRDTYSIRGTVTYRPNETLQNDLIVTYLEYSSHGSADFLVSSSPNDLGGLIGALYPSLAALFAQQQAVGARTHIPLDTDLRATGGSQFAVEDIARVSLGDELTFRNVLGMHNSDFNTPADLDGTALPIFDFQINDYRVHQLTEEAQLLGQHFGGRLNWQAGVFYLDQQGPPNDGFERQLLTILSGSSDSAYQIKATSKAIYSQGTYEMIPSIKLTAGVRYTWDTQNETTLGAAPGDITPPYCGTPSVNCSFKSSTPSDSSALTWTAGLDYQAAPNTLLYFTSRRGYRAGGDVVDEGIAFPFSPEYVNDFELGVKSDWSVGNVPIRTNADLYLQNYTNIQVAGTIPDPTGKSITGLNVTLNGAAARLWGAELEAVAQLTKDLQLAVDGSYLRFKYTEITPFTDPGTLIAGETANRVPRKYGASVRYYLPLPAQIGKLSLRANWSWQDAMGDFLGTSQIPAYGLLNTTVNWDGVGGMPLDASIFASNVLDRTYQTGGIGLGLGFNERTYGDPRMYGIRIAYRFGGEAKK